MRRPQERQPLEHSVVSCPTAAVAILEDGTEFYYNYLDGLGELRGVRTTPLDEGEPLYKIGRTTGYTRGRVSAIEVDDLIVGYDMGDLSFNGQFMIEPRDKEPFSLGGDSGSLIFDRQRMAVGLLFAGNDVDATFASPIGSVLDMLRVDLIH